MSESADRPTTLKSRDLIAGTTFGGRCCFHIHGDKVLRACVLCGAEFEQDDAGFAAMKEHEFTHGAATLFNWSEINGKMLRLVAIPYETDLKVLYSSEADLYAVDDVNGVVYHLNHEYGASYRDEVGGWKWKITNPMRPNDGPLRMLLGLASPSNG